MIDQGGADQDNNNSESKRTSYKKRLCQMRRLALALIMRAVRWWREGDHHRRASNFTVVLALGTLILAIANVFMLIEMRHAGRDTRRAVEATNRIADEARRQADIAQESQRPYVTAELAEFSINTLLAWEKGKEPLRHPFWVKNYGGVPAILDGAICYEIAVTNISNDIGDFLFFAQNIILPANAQSSNFRCGNKRVVGEFETLSSPDYIFSREEEIQSGRIWFVGKVRYHGFFGGPYETTFCLQMYSLFGSPRVAGAEGCNRHT